MKKHLKTSEFTETWFSLESDARVEIKKSHEIISNITEPQTSMRLKGQSDDYL